MVKLKSGIFTQDFSDSWNKNYVEERMEKFKYGPLIYNGMWDDDESGKLLLAWKTTCRL